MLENATVKDSAPGSLVIAVANKFYHSQLSGGRNSTRLAELVAGFTGTGTRIKVLQLDTDTSTIADERKSRHSTIKDERRSTLMNHPVTRAVENEMDGQVVDVRLEDIRDDE